MAQEFHFQHHMLEAKRNRFRFVAALLSIFVATTGIAVQQYVGLAENVVQVNDATVGTGLNQFQFSGSWQVDRPAGAFKSDNHYSDVYGAYYQVKFSGTRARVYGEKSPTLGRVGISIDGGAETIVDPYAASRVEQQLLYTSPVLSNAVHTVKVRLKSSKNAAATHGYISADRVDISVVTPPTATPVPTPVPTAKPVATAVPVAKPAATAAPVSRAPVATPRPVANAPAATTAPATAPAQDTAPSAPGDLSAMVTGDNAIITLIWSASSSGTGINGYRVERMADGGTWEMLGETSALTYMDNSAAFAVHYKYRVSAMSGTGKASEYATVDATTGKFVATAMSSAAGNFRSDDKLAAAEVPAGALAANANCSIVTMPLKNTVSKMKVVAGSYALVCKDSTGKVLKDFGRPVEWSVNLKGKLGGVSNPEVAVVDAKSGASASIPGAIYDSKTQIIRFNQTSATTVAVLGEAKRGVPVLWFVFIGIALALWVAFIILLRSHQIEKYRDYIMSKYYNL